jgi:hypothetical protein
MVGEHGTRERAIDRWAPSGAARGHAQDGQRVPSPAQLVSKIFSISA